jgi:nitrogen PTS system EIIA component
MQITVREACELLNLSESVLYRLVRRKEIPAYSINKSYLFNRLEILEWAITNNKYVSPKVLEALSHSAIKPPTIVEALRYGGIHYGVPGNDKREVLREIVRRIPSTAAPDLNGEALFSALIARETLGSTAIGNGIAIPHVRNPIVLDVEKPLIMLCFLAKPIDFDALDGKPVDTIFILISTTVRIHLHILAHLSFLLQSDEVKQALRPGSNTETLLEVMKKTEASIRSSSDPVADSHEQGAAQ